MFKKSIITLLLLIVFGIQAHAQEKCNTYSEPSIGVTFCAPQNWLITKNEGGQYSKIFGERHQDFTPNINVNAVTYAASLSKTADEVVKDLLKTKGYGKASRIEVKSKIEFAAETKGIKVVYDGEFNGLNVRTIQYFFKGLGNTKIAVTATLLLSDADTLEKLIDASINTLKITDKPVVRIGTKQ